MTKFFSKLPTISYKGFPAKNFMARAKLSKQTEEDKTLFYPYTLKEDDRLDVLSQKYYENPDYVWLINFANKTVDPYYDYYLNDQDFSKFIEKKYGTISNAQIQIAFYRNNWSIDDSQISISVYNNLPGNLKKYYTPVVDQYNNIFEYERKKEDWIVSTNKIYTLEISGNSFSEYDRVQQKFSNGSIIANGFVSFSNSSVVTIQHVDGNFENSNTTTLNSANNSANVITATLISENISNNEIVFWNSVTYFEYETEINTQKKEINLIDNRFKRDAEEQLRRLMSR